MIILFEEHAYDKDVVQKYVHGLHLKRLKENRVSIPYVGYYYSSEVDDSVFILPKVFINVRKDENGKDVEKAFGIFDPITIIDTNDKKNPLLGSTYYMEVFNLSTWIYRAIERYKERNSTEDIIEPVNVLSVDSANGDKSQTQINIILDLIRFNKEHQNLFTFIARISSQGHHRVKWQKTISKRLPFIQDDAPIYMETISHTKVINPDEELIVLFFSVMDYLHAKFHFRVIRNVNYVTFTKDIEKLIQSGKGTRLLKKIRRKYYKDDLVKLWNLLYVFFKRAESMKSKKQEEEFLLVRNFNLVFEDMIDSLISDDTKQKDKKLADQRDGKIVDHIYRYESLVHKDKIYYIGDSKYYKEGSDPGDPSIYKQFTYAKNVIQRNMDLADPSIAEVSRKNYFDPSTEGYNVTPNFFIRGVVEANDYNYKFRLEPTKNGDEFDVEQMEHHKNRLFDRDTLLVLKYNINFLFVLSNYASNHTDDNLRRKIRKDFRAHVMNQLVLDYDFYTLRAKEDRQTAIDKHFKLLIGKIFSAFDDERLLMADDKRNPKAEQIFEKIDEDFDHYLYNLLEDKEEIVEKEPTIVYHKEPVEGELKFTNEDTDDVEEEEIEILDDVDDDEKYVDFLPLYSIKAACGRFGDGELVEPQGWIRVEGHGRLNKDMFVVQAKGHSMEPKINEGQYCVFRKYKGGTREEDVVLCQHRDYFDEDNAGAYSIKKYHREKYLDENNNPVGEKVILSSRNRNYEPIEIIVGDDEIESFKVIGVFDGPPLG